MAVSPSGRFAYVVNSITGNVSAYAVNVNTGALTPVPSSPFAAGSFPISVTTTAPEKRCKREKNDRRGDDERRDGRERDDYERREDREQEDYERHDGERDDDEHHRSDREHDCRHVGEKEFGEHKRERY